MKKLGCYAFLYLNFIIALLSGKIIESEHFNEIIPYANLETLVILDIDDTLLIPTQTLGTDIWFLNRIKQNQAKYTSSSEAFEKSLAEWEAIRHITPVKLVEAETDNIIKELQNKHITVMGLTTQGLALTTRTIQQLNSLNIDLSATAPSQEDHYFMNQHGVLYRKGILFTSGTPKGMALLKFLDIINFHPKKVVFINDKATHLKDVEQSLESQNIEFIGLRYSYSDKRVANFRPEIAEIQWLHSSFEHIISDEEAETLLKACKIIP